MSCVSHQEDDLDAKGESARRSPREQREKKSQGRRINWIQNVNNEPFLLNLLPIDAPRMDRYGVYIIWCFDKSGIPITVRTGIKSPNDHLIVMRNVYKVKKYAAHTLYITWAESKSSELPGIWTYLCNKLQPLEGPHYLWANPIPVSLPLTYNKPPPEISHTEYSEPPPEISQEDPYWRALSDWYREQKCWTCEHCGLNLEHQKQFLHTHHTRGRAYNSPEHLKALCVKCHADEKFPIDHSFMKDSPEYREFMSGEADVDDER